MKFFMIGPYYLYWHYTMGIRELLRNLWNFIVFEFHFFSVKELVLTLFAPFQRLKETYDKNFLDIERLLSSFVINIIMRIIGFCVRSFILLCALISISLSLILFPFIILIWLALPVLLCIFIIGSIVAYIIHRF
jgi:hypothetical protein